MSIRTRVRQAYRRGGLRHLAHRAFIKLFNGVATPIETIALLCYRIYDINSGRCKSGLLPLRGPSLYHIDFSASSVEPFDFWFPLRGLRYRRRIVDDYETEVTKLLSKLASDNETFWEVGAAWGYHSLAFAPQFDEIVCFEQNEEYAEKLSQSVEENGYKNIDITRERVESLDDYLSESVPDVILMDVDGWEYTIMSRSPETIDANPIWIVELHDSPPVDDDIVKPREVEKILSEAGYEISVINERGSFTRFGREQDNLNNWHILAVPPGSDARREN